MRVKERDYSGRRVTGGDCVRLGFGLDVEGGVTFMLAEGTGHAQAERAA